MPGVTQVSQKAYSRQGFADSQAANPPFPVFSASGFISPQRQRWFEVPLGPPECPLTHNSALAAMGLSTDGASRQQLPLAAHRLTGEGLTSLFAPIPLLCLTHLRNHGLAVAPPHPVSGAHHPGTRAETQAVPGSSAPSEAATQRG